MLAGTPSISDPGYLIVKLCINNDVEVECLPGPTQVEHPITEQVIDYDLIKEKILIQLLVYLLETQTV